MMSHHHHTNHHQIQNTQRRRRWTEVAEQITDGMVPPVVLFGGTLSQYFTLSTALNILLLVVAVAWILKQSSDKSKSIEEEEGEEEKQDSAVELKTAKQEKPTEQQQNDEASASAAVAAGAKPQDEVVPDLFPAISNVTINNADEVTAKSCSTGLTTRLLPFKNKNGEIEWAFTDDMSLPGSELDVFKIKNDSEAVSGGNLTPTTSNSSNSDSILQENTHKGQEKHLSNNNNNANLLPQLSDTPLTNNSPFSDGELEEKNASSTSSSNEQLDDEDSKTEHQCPHCDVSFKIRGYLTRHLKKHAIKKAYSCPFYKYSIYVDENNLTHKCHPNGGFSRRDTYKTHLKSRHFKYPKGVKTKERTSSPGYCGMCNEYFPNSEIWCEIHIEGGECRHLPAGFTGKSRIKNKLRKEQQRQRMKGNSHANASNNNNNNNSATHDLISGVTNVQGIPMSANTNSTSPSKTPSTYNTPQSYSYYNAPNMGTIMSSNSPTYSTISLSDMQQVNYANTPMSNPSTYQISPSNKVEIPQVHQQSMLQYSQQPQQQSFQQVQHHLQNQQHQQDFVSQIQDHQGIPQSQPLSDKEHQLLQYQHQLQQQQQHPQQQQQQQQQEVQFIQFQRQAQAELPKEDYDDEYCLDMDQLFVFNQGKEIYN